MLPALSTPERAQLLAGAQAQLPPPAFAAMAAVAQSVLGRECWLARRRARPGAGVGNA